MCPFMLFWMGGMVLLGCGQGVRGLGKYWVAWNALVGGV